MILRSLAIANFFDCKCWRSETELIFFGMARAGILTAFHSHLGHRYKLSEAFYGWCGLNLRASAQMAVSSLFEGVQ